MAAMDSSDITDKKDLEDFKDFDFDNEVGPMNKMARERIAEHEIIIKKLGDALGADLRESRKERGGG